MTSLSPVEDTEIKRVVEVQRRYVHETANEAGPISKFVVETHRKFEDLFAIEMEDNSPTTPPEPTRHEEVDNERQHLLPKSSSPEPTNRRRMALKKSTAVFGAVVVALLIVCVGLLVALLKNQKADIGKGLPDKTTASQITQGSTSTLGPSTDPMGNTTDGPTLPFHNYRLPKTILPIHYTLTLEPNLKDDVFKGSVNIEVIVTTPTEYFIVHYFKNKITIDKVTVTDATGKQLPVKEKFDYEPNEYYVIQMEATVNVGTYFLKFEFTGGLTGSIVGFYKSTYVDRSKNETRSLATSKFQPTYARRAFPCFDEPNFKSNFTVTLIHDQQYNALSNMPVKKVTVDESKQLKTTEFETSVEMVTYLTCFVVSDFEALEGQTSKNIPFRVFATPDQKEKTKFARDTGIKILDFYEDYFEIDFPLPKSDMIAIPDFSSGAMEHWGLITYRETNLLYDEKESSPQNKQRVASVISHELAHMWFGNLVTMEWWDDLWLNEGFASYIEYKGVDHVYPEWMMMDQILTEDMQPVIRLDSTTRSHPIIQAVNKPDEITEIFDAISYNKGAAVLRMLESFVSDANFQKGIKSFLQKYAYKNAKTSQLWDEISEQSNKNIADVMDTWTKQMGLPYVTVTRIEGTKQFQIDQKRFLLNSQMTYNADESPFNYVWKIPLSYVTSKGEKGLHWLNSTRVETITIEGDWEWVKFNEEHKGYYIVNYGKDQFKEFSRIFLESHEKMSPSDRSGLLFDAFQLAQAGAIQYDIPLKMTTYLMNERHLTPWETAYSSFVQLGYLFQGSDEYEKYKTYLRQLTQPLYRTLGWKAQLKHSDSLLQTTIIGLACYSGNEDCRKQAVNKLQSLKEGKEVEIPLALRSIVFKYAIEADSTLWDFMWEQYMKESSAQEKVKLLYGLSHSQDEQHIKKLIEYAKDTNKIRSQDFFTVLNYIAGNPKGRPIVWDWVRENWEYLVGRFTINDRYLGRTVKTICDYFTTEQQLNQTLEFFEKYPDAGAGQRARLQAIENIHNNINWLGTHRDKVSDYLDKNSLPWSDFRLTDSVIPLTYDLTLKPEIDGDTFKGNVKIRVNVTEETQHFVVHADPNLKITASSVHIYPDDEPAKLAASFAHKTNEFWVMETQRQVAKDSLVDLSFEFEGFLNLSLVGLYKSSYTDKKGKTRNLVTSQFQSTHARKAFPCFDEPKFKSNFTVHLVHPKGYTALSNMPASSVQPEGDLVKTSFEESVSMVTYLVCVTISDFKSLEAETKNGTKVRVHSRPDEVNKLAYALSTAVKTLEYFEDYFGIPYPLPKLDMLAIPDFQAGAMENWGIITYRETLMIYNETENSPYNQFRITAVIGHEIAHMWFGNLVTMKWWDDLWLNEGFASYMEYKSMGHVQPTWDVQAQFFTEDMYAVLLPDAATTSHPIVQTVNHPDEITALFDAISYNKGASVLRMLEFFLGPDIFREGVSNYLSNFAYDNAVTADLWRYLSEAAISAGKQNLNISAIMDTWTRQMGYPYVTITKLPSDDPNKIKFKLTQNRFLIDNESSKKDDSSAYGYKWHIPLSYKTAADPSKTEIEWMDASGDEKEISVPKSDWTKFNADLTSYYIVNYGDNFQEMINVLNTSPKQLSASDRANLISDAFFLARAGHLNYTVALDLTKYLTQEDHFVPWETARKSLAYIVRVLEQNEEVDGELKAYLEILTSDSVRKLGWGEIKDHLQRRMRETIVDLACGSGNGECLAEAAKQLRRWKEGETISPDLKLLVFEYGMQEIGDQEMWEHMWDRYRNESSSQEQRNLLFGLASTKESTLLSRLLKEAENSDVIRSQDYFTVLGYVAGNPVGLPIVWHYIRDNWSSLVDRFTISDRYLGNAVKTICNHFTTPLRLQEMLEFFAKYPEAGAGERARKEAIINVENNIKWLEKYEGKIHDWLKTQSKKPWHNVRLTESVIPVDYTVRLHPEIEEGTFKGSVDIFVKVTEETKYFLVHSHLLTISKSSVKSEGIELDIAASFEYKKNNYWVVELKEPVQPGNYTLSYEFSGSLLNKLYGFYRSSYVDRNTGQTKYLATSQFQSTYAREAFPCFDEPSVKSQFTITLLHKDSMKALSNMPIESSNTNTDGLIETKFEKSVPMVTYLVAVIVCDFEFTNTTTKAGTEVRVFAPPDRVNESDFALKAGVDVLEYFEEYFNVKYPLPKLDMIAIPDFRAGAMENWGLITYREAYLLFDKQTTSPSAEFSIVMIVAHEIAHMWFGNLVTMKWWDDLWLNEGFATFMAYKCVDNIRPDMNAIGLFLLGETADVLEPDATLSSHPIVQEVNNPDEISAIFDSISYSKGASVLRKLETYLTNETFRSGISKYLKSYQYQNAKTDDLWEALQLEDNTKTVKEVMDTWTKQMGYPYISINFNPDLKSAKLSQERFLLNPESAINATTSPYNYIWKVPIEVSVDGVVSSHMLGDKEEQLNLASATSDSLVKLNAGQSGYYLVNYEESVWNKWAQKLTQNRLAISGIDRSNLLSDAFLLARAGHLNYSVALEMSKYLETEEDFVPWTTAKRGLSFISNLLDSDTETHDKMTNYLKNLSKNIYEKLGWEDDPGHDYLQRRLRSAIADLACKSGNEKCLEAASKKLKDFIDNKTPIPSALRSLVFRYGLWHDDSLWEPLWQIYLNETSAQTQRELMSGLAYTQNETQISRYIELGKENVRSQDFLTLITSVGSNPKGLQLAWDFVRNEWQYLVDKYTINDRSLGGTVLSICSHFKTEEKLKEMRQFFADYPDAGAGKSSRKEALEIVEGNIKWLRAYLPVVREWLNNKTGASS